MRAALGLAFIAAIAVTGCRSEEQQKAEFRQQFLSQCAQTIRAQTSAPAGLNPDSVCTCVADKMFAGKSTSEINKIVNEQTGVAQATTECAMQQLGGAAGAGAPPAQPGAAQPPAGTAATAEQATKAAEEAADDTTD